MERDILRRSVTRSMIKILWTTLKFLLKGRPGPCHGIHNLDKVMQALTANGYAFLRKQLLQVFI